MPGAKSQAFSCILIWFYNRWKTSMKSFAPFVVILLSLVVSVQAQNKGIAARAYTWKFVETYEADIEQYRADPKTAKRYLSGVSRFDGYGKIAERWDVSGGASYMRTVFSRDRYGRETSQVVFLSPGPEPGR